MRAKEALELKTQELARSLAMLRATLESTTDGILVTDGGGKVTGFNQKFVEMWRMPPEVLASGEHQKLLEANSREFEDPLQFLATVRDVYASSPPESHDLLELADGRVFERFSRIQFVEERNVGRVWSFRDINDRKRVETARFLAEASATLVDLADDESTLQKVARLAVPTFADWCAVDMAGEGGLPRRLAVAHVDPAKVEFAHDLHRRYPPDPDAPHGVPQVIRTGESELVAEITDEMLVAGAQGRRPPPPSSGSWAASRTCACRSRVVAARSGRSRSSPPSRAAATGRTTSGWPRTWPLGGDRHRERPPLRRAAGRPTAARTSSSRCSPTSCATRSPPIRNAVQLLAPGAGDARAPRAGARR